MRTVQFAAAAAGALLCLALSANAQQACPGFTYVANSPEDSLIQAVTGAENPQEQIAALDKFAQEHADSKFMPCVNEYYTAAYVKANNFDKAIEYGEKDLAANYNSLNLSLNLMKAYVGAGKATDSAFQVIAKAPELIKAETNPTRPAGASDEEWQKTQQENAELAKDSREYMEYAFFQLLPRVPDAKKRISYLDAFMKAYPDTKNVAQVNLQYLIAYKMANEPAKADEYGEKAIAADPNNVEALNLVADDYATRRTNLNTASDYAKKVLTLVPAMKKPEGMSDDQFKASKDTQLGLAHLTLGYIAMQRGASTHKVAPAIEQLKAAVNLLESNPELQGKALYFLGYAYELLYPPNHRAAADALERASKLQSGFQGRARELLAKVERAR
jgi:tetratricopeptide (TPR) repeat protein